VKVVNFEKSSKNSENRLKYVKKFDEFEKTIKNVKKASETEKHFLPWLAIEPASLARNTT